MQSEALLSQAGHPTTVRVCTSAPTVVTLSQMKHTVRIVVEK